MRPGMFALELVLRVLRVDGFHFAAARWAATTVPALLLLLMVTTVVGLPVLRLAGSLCPCSVPPSPSIFPSPSSPPAPWSPAQAIVAHEVGAATARYRQPHFSGEAVRFVAAHVLDGRNYASLNS